MSTRPQPDVPAPEEPGHPIAPPPEIIPPQPDVDMPAPGVFPEGPVQPVDG